MSAELWEFLDTEGTPLPHGKVSHWKVLRLKLACRRRRRRHLWSEEGCREFAFKSLTDCFIHRRGDSWMLIYFPGFRRKGRPSLRRLGEWVAAYEQLFPEVAA